MGDDADRGDRAMRRFAHLAVEFVGPTPPDGEDRSAARSGGSGNPARSARVPTVASVTRSGSLMACPFLVGARTNVSARWIGSGCDGRVAPTLGNVNGFGRFFDGCGR